MSEPVTDVQLVDNVFVKMHHFLRVGDTHQGHAHIFDHITLLATGAVTMKHDNGEEDFTAPHLIVTPKGVTHQFIAKQPNTVFCCIHAVRDGSTVDDVVSQDVTPDRAFELLTQYPLAQE